MTETRTTEQGGTAVQHTYGYTVRYNEQTDPQGRRTGFFGYQPGDELRTIHTARVQAASPEQALEIIFRRFNVVNGTERPVLLGVRSMSVGDVVTLTLVHIEDGDEVAEPVASYACADFGWDILRTAAL